MRCIVVVDKSFELKVGLADRLPDNNSHDFKKNPECCFNTIDKSTEVRNITVKNNYAMREIFQSKANFETVKKDKMKKNVEKTQNLGFIFPLLA
jgi:hypothetical protein